MKKLLFTLGLFAFSVAGFAQEISFEKTTHDFGTIEYMGNGKTTFTYTNTGDKPLIISRAKGSCGCTVPTYSREPLAPGKSADITVKYDTKRVGNFTKSVTITSNSITGSNSPQAGQKKVVLKIKGKVGPKPTKAEEGLLNQNSSPMMPKSN